MIWWIQVLNRGRVICISSFREDGYIRSLESLFQDTLVQINQQNFPPSHMPIHHCDLVIINIYPNPSTSTIKGLYAFIISVSILYNSSVFFFLLKFKKIIEHPRLELSPLLSCELISVCASRWLASRLVRFVNCIFCHMYGIFSFIF